MINWKSTDNENKIRTMPLNVTILEEDPKVINEYEKYQKTLSQLIAMVIIAANEISDNLFNLACQGKLQEWDKKQPNGTVVHVTEKLLRSVGDENIDLLLGLFNEIENVAGKIKIKTSDLRKMFSRTKCSFQN